MGPVKDKLGGHKLTALLGRSVVRRKKAVHSLAAKQDRKAGSPSTHTEVPGGCIPARMEGSRLVLPPVGSCWENDEGGGKRLSPGYKSLV